MAKWIPSEIRLLLTALAIAAAVHLLLLGLFSHQPRRILREDALSRPPVLLQLDRPENRKLAQWIRHHDPSLIAAPDAVSGYGASARDPQWHAAIADLPRVPALAAPTLALPLLPPDRINADAPVPATALRPQNADLPPKLVVTLNGRILPDLSRSLTRLAEARKKVGSITFAIEPSAVPGVPGACRIVRTSGVPEWDQAAAEVIAIAALPSGELAVEPEARK